MVKRVRRAIEVEFPIAEVNSLAEPERKAFLPIYRIHRWFARRSSSVFRAILLGALRPAERSDGTKTDIMADFYRDHSGDPETRSGRVLDPFMGGGTTVVEALRLGCRVTGIDLNPVAWFVVKCEVEPAAAEELETAVERLARRPVNWNRGRPLRETLRSLYQTELEPPRGTGVSRPPTIADVIYTYWAKHAPCAACGHEVPLLTDYLVSRMAPSVRYFRDFECPECHKKFDWEIEPATLVADPALSVCAPRGGAGEGRGGAAWAYARSPKGGERASVVCPHCRASVQPALRVAKPARKKVPLAALLCPECRAVWQWRGPFPEGIVCCPACRHQYEPPSGNVPQDGKYRCRCGHQGRVMDAIRSLPADQRLPIRPFAQQVHVGPQAWVPVGDEPGQRDLFPEVAASRPAQLPFEVEPDPEEGGYQLPKNRRVFKRFTARDEARLQEVERIWLEHGERLPHPATEIPQGDETNRLLEHHYRAWKDMFLARQLLGLSTLLGAIGEEPDPKLRELLLCGFSSTLEYNNQFTRYMTARRTPGGMTTEGVFARHDFQPKLTFAENNVWGLAGIGKGPFESRIGLVSEALAYRRNSWNWLRSAGQEQAKVSLDPVGTPPEGILCRDSAEYFGEPFDLIVTDPPYVGNVNYAELSNFYYVWLRLLLKSEYPHFLPEFVPSAREIVENRVRGKSRADFFSDLAQALRSLRGSLTDDGLLVFTFHHTDSEGDVWEGLLRALCETGYEIVAVYPIHGESESSLHLQGKENVSYDLIHVCRKRDDESGARQARSWAGLRQEVRRRARVEIEAIEAGRYGGRPLSPGDVRLVCIGKCLEVFSRHYGSVFGRDESDPVDLPRALADIGAIVDQLATTDRPLPAELEADLDAVSYAWFRVLLPVRGEIRMDDLHKALRGMRLPVEELRRCGLIIRGRAGRGRTYEVKAPRDRLDSLLDSLGDREAQAPALVDLTHLFLGLAQAGAPALPWARRFWPRRRQIAAALRHCASERRDWADGVARILPLLEELPMFEPAGELKPKSA